MPRWRYDDDGQVECIDSDERTSSSACSEELGTRQGQSILHRCRTCSLSDGLEVSAAHTGAFARSEGGPELRAVLRNSDRQPPQKQHGVDSKWQTKSQLA